MSRRDSSKIMRKEWQGGRSTHHDVVLTIPVRKECRSLQIFKQLFSNHFTPCISSALFSNGCHYTAAASIKLRACQKKEKKKQAYGV